MSISDRLRALRQEIPPSVDLIAVSKFKPVADLEEAYACGQRDFGENYVQELVEKESALPKDVRWHFIGHLQTNKVKYIAPFVHLIHSVDSLKLLKEIQKQGASKGRIISVLLQAHIAEEESKTGFDIEELKEILQSGTLQTFPNVKVEGLMGMGTFTEDADQTRREFKHMAEIFEEAKQYEPGLKILSMGMSGDWKIAVEEGSNMVRIGSTIFGSRN
ncbi:alanine racemase domain protein [Leadbetterella byssophila DSM 17132]|uniref:Pyridoxal phosphate homeostasis protein n=1 Tax=Leadbetterella byssophila (strain DSM 17132 / JCM 16389 / KACC 11308 / NBRC 106382 / 4M15) TaxID=649349 RepID=E4RRX9_LEAB4|nr:YggS family pyridoxal phosphate-dependent enzyme [Leadbetterella byssophila]ADQ18511.1 alanine racemase domain protein [Leadbetterella byssophila DSM 17132]